MRVFFYCMMKLGEGVQKGSYPFSVNNVTLLSAFPGLGMACWVMTWFFLTQCEFKKQQQQQQQKTHNLKVENYTLPGLKPRRQLLR